MVLFLTGSASRLDIADKLASVGGILVGVASLVISVVTLRATLRNEIQPGQLAYSRAADRMAAALTRAVRKQWTTEASGRALLAAPMQLHWSRVSEQLPQRWENVAFPDHGDLDDLRALIGGRSSGPLIVLGRPGAGKTAVATLLTLELCENRSSSDPVPILLSISSWDPASEHLDSWLARRLDEDYPALASAFVGRTNIGTTMVLNQRIIPILDGLDEMSEALRPLAIDGLDLAVAENWQLILTCRTQEYRDAMEVTGQALKNVAVVELEPLTVDDLIDYLHAGPRDAGDRWEPLFTALRTDPTGHVAAVLSTPLMAYLARIAYVDPASEPSRLADRQRFATKEDLEDHLLDRYLETVYSNHRRQTGANEPSYTPDEIKRWLNFIARHCQRLGTIDIAWWEIRKTAPRPVAATAIAVGAGLPVGIANTFGTGWLAGVISGVVVAAIGVLLALLPQSPSRVGLQLRGRRWISGQQMLNRVTSGRVIAAVFGTGLALGVVAGLGTNAKLGVLVGLGVGLAALAEAVIRGWLRAPSAELNEPRPEVLLRGDLVFAATTALFSASFFGLISLLLAGWPYAAASFTSALLIASANTASGSYLIAVTWFAFRGSLPLRLLAFLKEIRRRGAMRTVGSVYQFRHQRLLDRIRPAAAPAAQPAPQPGDAG